MKLPAQNRSILSIITALALGLCAVYCIPFYVPVRDGLSYSYLFGYSNRAAILLLAAFSLGFALWTRGLGLTLPEPSASPVSSTRNKWVVVTIAVLVIGCCIVWIWASRLIPYGEAEYFLDRYEMFRMGGRVFRDFAFDYGPLMFYLPVWISKICHLTLGNSYYLAWTLQWALGGWALWKTVAITAHGSRHARTVYLLLWVLFCSAVLDGGTNYTPLRFVCPLLFALAVCKLYTRGASHLATFSLACAAATALLFYSPEQGIVFTIATLLYFLVCVRSRRPGTLAALGFFCLVMAGAFWLAFKVGDLDNVRRVGAGTLNFPILFSFQTFVLLLFVVAAGCVVVAAFRTGKSHHPLLYLICLSAVSMPAAFSRADIGHIIANSLGALIATLVVLSQYPAIWRWTWSSFALVVLLGAVAHAEYYRGQIRGQLGTLSLVSHRNLSPARKAYAVLFYLIHQHPQTPIVQPRTANRNDPDPTSVPLPKHANLFAPLGDKTRLIHVADDPTIVTGRYAGLFPMSNVGPIQEKIDELKVHPDWPLLMPTLRPASCVEDPRGIQQVMKKLLLVPYVPQPRRQLLAAVPFCDFLNTNYRQSNYQSPVPGYWVWVPKGNSHAVP